MILNGQSSGTVLLPLVNIILNNWVSEINSLLMEYVQMKPLMQVIDHKKVVDHEDASSIL